MSCFLHCLPFFLLFSLPSIFSSNLVLSLSFAFHDQPSLSALSPNPLLAFLLSTILSSFHLFQHLLPLSLLWLSQLTFPLSPVTNSYILPCLHSSLLLFRLPPLPTLSPTPTSCLAFIPLSFSLSLPFPFSTVTNSVLPCLHPSLLPFLSTLTNSFVLPCLHPSCLPFQSAVAPKPVLFITDSPQTRNTPAAASQ